jgi:4-hydroxy-4-methyl-2-oxoglutarate aldolase
LVITMPEPAPFGAVGELIVLQAQARGAAGMLVDVAVRDIAELKEIGLPIWARFVRVRGTKKADSGRLDVPVVVGGATIRPGDVVVMDDDGVVVVAAERVEEVAEAARAREERNPILGPGYGRGSSPTTCSGYVPRNEADVKDPERGSLAAGALG